MPEAGQALLRTLNDENADVVTVCQIIKNDPALTANLLRMANSAMFGLSGTIATIERAVNVVGMSLVRSRAMALCVARVCTFPVGMDRMAFWQYSLRCAHYAQWLAGGNFLRLAGVLHLAARLADGGAITAQNIEQLPGLLMQVLKLDGQHLLDNPPPEEALDASFFG